MCVLRIRVLIYRRRLTSPQAYLIIATVVGAALGHFIFSAHIDIESALGGAVDAKGMACH